MKWYHRLTLAIAIFTGVAMIQRSLSTLLYNSKNIPGTPVDAVISLLFIFSLFWFVVFPDTFK